MKNSQAQDFPHNTISFLKKLARNNNKDWFEKNREMYDLDFLQPAVHFVLEMGSRLSDYVPDIQAVPKINKSIFKLYRDVRFSKNKQPFKTNLGIFLWEGGNRLESPGFYFHLEPQLMFLGAGIYKLDKNRLKLFREAVSDQAAGNELLKIMSEIKKKKGVKIGGEKYKKLPEGYDPYTPAAEFLLYDSLYAFVESDSPASLSGNKLLNYVFKKFIDFLPLHNWLLKALKYK